MCDVLVAGDLVMGSSDNVVAIISRFLQSNSLTRCDQLFPSTVRYTYVNDHLIQQSYIDYTTTSSPGSVLSFNILDPDINFSDHFSLL